MKIKKGNIEGEIMEGYRSNCGGNPVFANKDKYAKGGVQTYCMGCGLWCEAVEGEPLNPVGKEYEWAVVL